MEIAKLTAGPLTRVNRIAELGFLEEHHSFLAQAISCPATPGIRPARSKPRARIDLKPLPAPAFQ